MNGQRARIDRIRKLCPYRYDDSEDGIDMCSKLGCHCVAMDSPFSHAERGESICKVYNALQADGAGKECALCHTPFTPYSNRQKYCPHCAATAKREKARKRKQMSRIRTSERVEL